MGTFLLALSLLWALFGHTVLCLALVNRIHAVGIPIRFGKLIWLSLVVIVPSLPILFLFWFWVRAQHLGGTITLLTLPPAALPYLATCWLAAVAIIVHWFRRHVTGSPPGSLRSDRRRVFQLLQNPETLDSEDHEHHYLVRLPGNQILELEVAERGLDVPGLPPTLDGFTVLHLSDLHFTGLVAKAYFQEMVQISNDLAPDLVVLTGDLIDSPTCLDWIPDTLGRLRGRLGCYFILGNHDLEVGSQVVRATLEKAGLIDLGGRWVELQTGDECIVLAGNELPWLAPAADFKHAPPPARRGGPVRIALAHSPDQLPWAQRNEVDLLLAGHLHGGQIRIPFLGPIVSPSWHGVRYASGVFHSPPTLMHVSRGVSGEVPLRLNCRPEIAKLTLHPDSLPNRTPDRTA
jgi:uncharacterized protein